VTQIYGVEVLRDLFAPDDVLAAVREALIGHARGEYISPPPGQLVFDAPRGDCHIKYGYRSGGPFFVIKVATGFYDNRAIGRPVNDGLMLLISAATGEPLAILKDEGWLTSWRTAAAGALAIVAGANPSIDRLGIIGAGHQAELQAVWASRALGDVPVMLWGRLPVRAEALAGRLRAAGVRVEVVHQLQQVLATCRAIIVCTASATPLFATTDVLPGTHIVSLGADTAGKRELEPQLFARAAAIATDDHAHCLAAGDFGHAVEAGFVRADGPVHLGAVLAGACAFRQRPEDITLVTLTGLGAEDLAIASLAWRALRAKESAMVS
jgi:ornithine cyclodeaminase